MPTVSSLLGYTGTLYVLLLLLLGTRLGHVLPGIPPDASWAIFLLGGYYLRDFRAFGMLFALAILVDTTVIASGMVAGACVNWGYLALLPAYGALFYGGYLSGKHVFASMPYVWLRFAYTIAIWVVAVSIAFVVSNAGFYWANMDMSLIAFVNSVAPYYSVFLISSLCYGVLLATVFQLTHYFLLRKASKAILASGDSSNS